VPEIRFDWLNDGESFSLPGIPIAGAKELSLMRKQYAATVAKWVRGTLLARCAVICAVKEVLDKKGVAEAKRIWDGGAPTFFSEHLHDDLIWDEGEFEAIFAEWWTRECLDKLPATDIDDAKAKIKEETVKLKSEGMEDDFMDYQTEAFLVEMNWRLKGKFDTMDVDGETVPLTKENLAQVLVFPDDAARIRLARVNRKSTMAQELETPDQEGVKKKQSLNTNPSEQSSVPLPDSSEPTGETTSE